MSAQKGEIPSGGLGLHDSTKMVAPSSASEEVAKSKFKVAAMSISAGTSLLQLSPADQSRQLELRRVLKGFMQESGEDKEAFNPDDILAMAKKSMMQYRATITRGKQPSDLSDEDKKGSPSLEEKKARMSMLGTTMQHYATAHGQQPSDLAAQLAKLEDDERPGGAPIVDPPAVNCF
jgi:hypothetical protein